MENHPDALLLLDSDRKILLASKIARKIYGYTAQDVSKMRFDDLTLSGSAIRLLGLEETFNEFFRRKDGRIVYMEVRFCRFQAETAQYTIAVARAILPTSGAEVLKLPSFSCDIALCERYEAIAVGIIIYDPTGNIIFANRKLERTLNCPWNIMKEKFGQNSTWEFFDEAGTRIYLADFFSSHAIRSNRPVNNKIVGLKRTPGDSMKWLLVNATPIFEPNTQSLTEIIVTITDITVIHSAVETLHENERRLIFALESIHAGEWEFNVRDLCVRCTSRSAEIFLGEKCPEVIYTHWNTVLNYFFAEDRRVVEQSIQEATVHCRPFNVMGRILRDDGAERWVQISSRPQKVDVRVSVFCGIVVDVTEQKLSEIAQRKAMLHSHEIVVKEVVERFGLLHFVVDCDLRYIAFNNQMADLMARLFDAKLAIGQNFLDSLDGAAQKSLMERNLRRALAGDVFSFEYYFSEEQGGNVKCLTEIYCPIRDENRNVLGVSVFGYDPEIQKATQLCLRGAEYRYQELVEDTNLVFIQLNAQGELLYMNRFGCEFFEYDLSELVGKKFASVLAPPNASSRCDLRRVLPRILDKKFSGARRRTSELMTRTHKRMWIEWSYHWSCEFDQSRKVLVAAGIDVTRRILARRQEWQNYRKHRQQILLNEAINGVLPPNEFNRLARICRIPIIYPLVCLLFRPDDWDVEGDERKEEKQRQTDVLMNWLHTYGPGIIWQTADGVCMIISLTETHSQFLDKAARQKAGVILGEVMDFVPEVSWKCGATWTPDRSDSLEKVYFQARAALTFGPTIIGNNTIHCWRDLGSYQLLVRDIAGEEAGRFIEEQLGPLLRLENMGAQNELLSTLRELGSFDAEEKIAQRLHVHRQTVRYRKITLGKILSCDLSIGRVLNNLAMAAILWDLRNNRS